MGPNVEANSLEILERMLTFAPSGRMSARQTLEHDVFADFRDPSAEVAAAERISLAFEDEPVLTEAGLRKHFLKEIQKYHDVQGINAQA